MCLDVVELIKHFHLEPLDLVRQKDSLLAQQSRLLAEVVIQLGHFVLNTVYVNCGRYLGTVFQFFLLAQRTLDATFCVGHLHLIIHRLVSDRSRLLINVVC